MQNDQQDNEVKPGVAYVPRAAEPHVTDQPASNTPYTPTTNTSVGSPEAATAPQTQAVSETPPLPPEPPTQPLNGSGEAPTNTTPNIQGVPDEDNFDDEPGDSDEAEHPHQEPQLETMLLSWNAPEFVYTTKPAGWYLLLALFFAAMIGLAVYTKQYLTIGLLLLMAVALVIYAQRRPRTLNYSITTHGVRVGAKAYHFDSFSAFYEISDYGQKVLELVPTKQFGTLVSLPITNEQERETEKLLGSVLPKVPARNDMIDRLLRTLRF